MRVCALKKCSCDGGIFGTVIVCSGEGLIGALGVVDAEGSYTS